MDRRFRLSRYRFASAMSGIVNKYNLPFEDDMVVSIKSLTYDTPDGPKVWGEEPSDEILDISYENGIQCQESIVQKQNSDFEEGYTDDQSFEEGYFTDLYEESQFSPGNKRNAELASIKWHLANIHLKENIPLECSSGTPVKNKCKVEMDMLLEDCASSVPTTFTITRTKPRSIHQSSPLQEMENESLIDLIGYDVAQKKQLSSVSLRSPEPSNSAISHSVHGTIVPKNQSLCVNETGHSSFLEMYESADENCSWNNVTIADLYPGMVKTLSRLFHKVSHTASSNLLIKRYKYGYWHSKKLKFNTNTDRTRKSRVLKLKPGFITKNDEKKHKLSIGNHGHNSPFYNSKHQIQCSEKSISRIESSVSQKSDRMEIDCSGIVEDYLYSERIGKSVTEATVFPRTLYTEKTFLVKSTACFPSSLDSLKKNQNLEECSRTICTVDSDTTFNPIAEGNTGGLSTLAFKTTSCLSLSLNNNTNSVLQSIKSPVKTSDGLQRNHEIKTFAATVSLPRSHSFSSFHVNQSPISVNQKYEDAFEKIYKELCSPKQQKPFKFSDIYTSPRNSAEVHISGLNNLSSNFHKKTNNRIEDIYQKLCSEGFPKIPTFLRAANLKKYEGMQISETVNALVNSPVRTLPAVPRIKRVAHFCNEDSQSSPLKRLKNKSGNSYTVCQKRPCWKSIRSDATFTLHSPVKNSWASNMNYGFSVSSDHSFLATSIADMEESRIADMNENIPKYLQSCEFPRKSQNYIPKVSRKLSYNDGRVRSKELLQKDYEEPFLEGYGEENNVF
ncbi:Holliday junction recognition protein isoform X1 [Python bivittatus]|uniref:Holliday junction recognition protein isoform X1 n=1 Tax=Python bivittatus TaxID=176946 RepID=A0A9F5IWM8_PYTBI|nr:Holliday junction recognition protein isoform X1 [Python bivittatus]